MYERRTDLALEAHEALRGASLPGVRKRERERFCCGVTEVEIDGAEAEEALGKMRGKYVTVDLSACRGWGPEESKRAACAVGAELRELLDAHGVRSALVVGLGNDAMTPDAIGPQVCRHVLATRHLLREPAFAGLCPVAALAPGVLGRTGLEAFELIRGAVRVMRPDAVIAADALASRSLRRLCSTVQLSDTGIVPGSGVGNRRSTLSERTLGVPVFAVGVPTVVDALTLALDVLEESGGTPPEEGLRRRCADVLVTPRDIDAEVRELSRAVGYGINLALQPVGYDDLAALIG